MKILEWIGNWTRRQLWWLLPFIIIMPFVLWWWNANIDAIGHWLWTQLHEHPDAFLITCGLCVMQAVGIVYFVKIMRMTRSGK